jgi:hypothetical protein
LRWQHTKLEHLGRATVLDDAVIGSVTGESAADTVSQVPD